MEESEFGKGLVICLVKFAEHHDRLSGLLKMNEKMKGGTDNPEYWNESHAIEMLFNGASDHLYEIKVPKAWRRKKLGRMVKELQSKGLEIGHGFRRDGEWKKEDYEYLYDLCQQIALLIDKELGLEPQKGRW